MPLHHEMFEFVTVATVLAIPGRLLAIDSGQVRPASAPHAIAHDRRIAWMRGFMNLAPILYGVSTLERAGVSRRIVHPAVYSVTGRLETSRVRGRRFRIVP